MQIEQNTQFTNIKSKCEYLTQIFFSESKPDSQVFYKPFESPMAGSEKPRLYSQHLHQLIIQSAYLLYSCFTEKCNITFNLQQDLLYDSRATKNNLPLSPFLRVTITGDNPYPPSSCARELIQRLLLLASEFSETSPTPTKIFANQFRALKNLKVGDREFYLLLEETQLFRKFSTLLKIKNCMAMNLIRTDTRLYDMFRKAKQAEKEQVRKYNQHKNNKHTEKMLEHQKQIKLILTKFFKDCLAENPAAAKYEDGDYIEADSARDVKFSLKYYQKGFVFGQTFQKYAGGGVADTLPEQSRSCADFKRAEMSFSVEYCASRNSISVLLNSELALIIELADFYIFQCSTLIFDSTDIAIEIMDRSISDKSNQKPRSLAFKAVETSTYKEPVLEKILCMMDTVMIASRIVEPQILGRVSGGIKDYSYGLSQEVYRKMEHYYAIFKRCAKVVYSAP